MAEVYRRGKKKYLGIDFDANDYEQLRQIAEEDGDRGVSSLVRSIVRSWLRARAAGQPLPSSMLTIPRAGTALGSLSPTKFPGDDRQDARSITPMPPPRPTFDFVPENPSAEEHRAPEASDKSGDDN
jgi:hypothetical protein